MPFTKDEKRKYQRNWLRARRAKWLSENGPCKSCGSTEDLEVDHTNPELKVSHRIWSWSEDKRAVELSKCQVLCKKCHLKKTKKGYEETREHGTYNMYRAHGCRCTQCLACAKEEWAHWHKVARSK